MLPFGPNCFRSKEFSSIQNDSGIRSLEISGFDSERNSKWERDSVNALHWRLLILFAQESSQTIRSEFFEYTDDLTAKNQLTASFGLKTRSSFCLLCNSKWYKVWIKQFRIFGTLKMFHADCFTGRRFVLVTFSYSIQGCIVKISE